MKAQIMEEENGTLITKGEQMSKKFEKVFRESLNL